MSEWDDNSRKSNGKFQKLLQERINIVNPSDKPTAEEKKRLNKVESTTAWLKRIKNMRREW